MGIATPTNPSIVTSHSKGHNNNSLQYNQNNLPNSMSQDYHQGIFNFSNGFERSEQQQHIAQQIRRDKLRIQGFEPSPGLVGIQEEEEAGGLPVYETAGMLSEMFSFPSGGGGGATATELLENQILHSYRNPRAAPPADWFSQRQGMVVGGELGDSKNQTVINDTSAHHHHHHHQISSINAADSAAAMQLFLMNPQQQRSPSPSPSSHPPPPQSTSSTLHMLLPNPSSSSSTLQALSGGGAFSQFTWGNHESNNPNEIPGVVEGQGLSLSLSSSLQHLEAAKAEELRMGEGGMLFFGQGGGGSSATSAAAAQYQFKNLGGGALHLQGQNQFHVGSGSSNSFGTMNMLRNSKYAKAAQELLEEFCSVGRGQFKKNKFKKHNNNNNGNPNSGGGAGGGNSSSPSKDHIPPLSAADRLEHQRRKVDRRYNHYCEQMQMVVNSFDMVMGFGAAVPYTCLAQKAMSRHFRCLKDAIAAQLKHSCELLGDKDAGTSGVTKGETPRLRILEQSLRQQRAFHQMGMMEQEAWRPQRGLPERSVNILRAWLFEHFLHPYPSDADKHLLARQTGLSRNQVSNWFINARVRLWKPMVEEMYQQESKDEGTHIDHQQDRDQSSTSAQTPTPTTTSATTATAITPPPPKRSEINATENDPSFFAINRQGLSDNQLNNHNNVSLPPPPAVAASQGFPVMHEPDHGCRGNADMPGSTLIRFGTNAGDVSLTLGLRHAGNLPEKNSFSVRDFGGC
ncbi:hypothetical protein BUALT_Bualt04G0125000 [Buddleja alternifolia]|uniref:Homeobox domain-containing protein n=1 Tax=Buddleja alternifolia TaxID=168488 RepID=A0AAV6XNC9_9LAMI|nr:hypothetical protein BUALT_Bualt04G0125000 [Buddleja alternifolia]